MQDIVILGNARCFHTMDWYRTVKSIVKPRRVLFFTDLIDSEGHEKIVDDDVDLAELCNIDWLLLTKQSTLGNIWRNAVKAFMLPVQVLYLRRACKRNRNAIIHAHTMYYMWMCWIAGVKFIGTPQGGEVLVRSTTSKVYRYFAIKSLTAAMHVIVDSINMKNRIYQLCGVEAVVIQYGIDSTALFKANRLATKRTHIVSIRGITSNYRIDKIFNARNLSVIKPPLSFFYPFWFEEYKAEVFKGLLRDDRDLGRMTPKNKVYDLLANTLLAISIPSSDSSPRSVYEAIFAGCCVAVTYSLWIDSLPKCMRSRLFIVDLDNPGWLDEAVDHARSITSTPYIPSEEALNKFDQIRAMKIVCEKFYSSPLGIQGNLKW